MKVFRPYQFHKEHSQLGERHARIYGRHEVGRIGDRLEEMLN